MLAFQLVPARKELLGRDLHDVLLGDELDFSLCHRVSRENRAFGGLGRRLLPAIKLLLGHGSGCDTAEMEAEFVATEEKELAMEEYRINYGTIIVEEGRTRRRNIVGWQGAQAVECRAVNRD